MLGHGNSVYFLIGNQVSACFIPQGMRYTILLGIFVLLLAAVYFLWQNRFERSPEFSSFQLSDLRAVHPLPSSGEWVGSESRPRLKLRAHPGGSGVATRILLPVNRPMNFLHLRFQASARKLIPGRETWESGRGLIEWHSIGETLHWENDSFHSARYDQESQVSEVVMRPENPPAIPVLRIENLGLSGDYELSLFDVTVLRERPVWKIGRWFLLAGWLAWVLVWIGPTGKIGFPRSLAAAILWVLMGIHFVIPGPWSDVRSLLVPFYLGPEVSASDGPAASSAEMKIASASLHLPNSETVTSVGNIPIKGDFTLRLKHYAQKARPLLHGLLLFVPTLLTACLVGGKPAASLAVILSLAIESAQLAFGFGFDWVDAFDLLSDAAGIYVGLWVYGRLKNSRYGRHFRISNSDRSIELRSL
jgi:hypothetical protein